MNNFILAKLAKILPVDSTGTPLLTKQIQPVGASVSSNALTVTLSATVLEFRSSTLTSGVVNSRVVPSTISLTVPAGATLGTVNGAASRIAVLALDVSGTVELAVVNCNSSVDLSETGVITTLAMSTGADSAVAYSTTARSNVPYRVVGYVDSTQTTAGTWAVSPTKVAGSGYGLANGLMAGLLETAGYQKLPGGLILQWGTATTNGSGQATFNFPIAFPTFNAYSAASHGSGNYSTSISTGSSTLMIASLTISNTSANAGSGLVVRCFALGW